MIDKKVKAINLDYSEGEMPFPPLHPNCRCTIIPILIAAEVQMNELQLDRITHYEERYGGDKIEHSLLVGKDGNVILEKRGSNRSIGFTQNEYNMIVASDEAVFTHTHPNNTSFSGSDLSVFAEMRKNAEMRVAGKDYVFSVKKTEKTEMPLGRWGILNVHNKYNQKYADEFKAMYQSEYEKFKNMGWSEKLAQNFAADKANELHSFKVNTEFANKYNLIFTKEKIE
jgi:hypothetical protein